MYFNVHHIQPYLVETYRTQIGLIWDLNTNQKSIFTVMENNEEQIHEDLKVKLKLTRRPRRFKAGTDLTEKVNLVAVDVIEEVTDEEESLSISISLSREKK